MKFKHIKPGNIRNYLESSKNNNRWLFQHIPKTAGSSIVSECKSYIKKSTHLLINQTSTTTKSYETELNKRVHDFCTNKSGLDTKFITGHLRHQHINEILHSYPDTNVFTYLRHPAKRVISHYYYSSSPKHPSHSEFSRKYPTLQSFVTDKNSANFMTSFICGTKDISADELIDFTFNRYDFIGLQDLYSLSFRLLSSLQWFESKPKKAERVSSDKKDDVTEELLDEITHVNQLDMALYRAVRKIYVENRDELHHELTVIKNKQ